MRRLLSEMPKNWLVNIRVERTKFVRNFLLSVVLAAAACGTGTGDEIPGSTTSPITPPAASSTPDVIEPTNSVSDPTIAPVEPTEPSRGSIDWQPGLIGEEALVDIGGHKLEIVCTGSGERSVIFESGGGRGALDWYGVQATMPTDIRACAYTRAGLGRSDPVPTESIVAEIYGEPFPSAVSTVNNLGSLLEIAGISPPYILVGHSFGGLYIRLFAELYPENTAGLVFIDSSHPSSYKSSEIEEEIGKVIESVADTGPFDDLPIAVLSADPDKIRNEGGGEDELQAWLDQQSEIASLSIDSSHAFVEGAGHNIHGKSPEIVVQAIMDILAKVSPQ